MDNQKKSLGFNRRRFISRILPACSLACLGANSNMLGFSPFMKKAAQETTHKFDEEFPRKLTYRQVMELMYGRVFIPFVKFMSDEIGKEKLIPMLRKDAAIRGEDVGKRMVKQYKGNDFATLKKIFSPGGIPSYNISLTFSVTEDTDNVHEIKVTECIWADVFLKANAGDLGHAAVCFGDYAMATGFNPKIKMVRDKTQMQGHKFCNHRYLLEG